MSREHAADATLADIAEHRIPVIRTARFATLGRLGPGVRQLWFVLHGYGQLAPRFLRHFRALAGDDRLVVAPEGLSRFYVEPAHGGTHAASRVGASWMTREAREHEIDDYVAYLDKVAERVRQEIGDARPGRVYVLGFSQGVATAVRWIVRGAIDADELVCWAGTLPEDVDLAAHAERLRRLRITLVLGDLDEVITTDMLRVQERRLAEAGIEYHVLRFAGAHRIEEPALLTLARL